MERGCSLVCAVRPIQIRWLSSVWGELSTLFVLWMLLLGEKQSLNSHTKR